MSTLLLLAVAVAPTPNPVTDVSYTFVSKVANGVHSFLISPHVSEQRHLPGSPNALSTSHGEIEAIGIKSSIFWV